MVTPRCDRTPAVGSPPLPPSGRPGRPRARLRRGRATLAAAALAALAAPAGCYSLTGQAPSPEGPGIPKLLTARFEPDRIRVGEETTLVLTFEDTEGDVVEANLVPRIVDDFRLISSTSVIQRNIRRHMGEVVGTVRETFSWETPSIRMYDVYVVDLKGNASNRISVRVTVR